MIEQEDEQTFCADYVRKLQAEVVKKKEEEQHFIDTFGIEKRIFEYMMLHIREMIMNMTTTTDTEIIIHVTDAYRGTPYWMNTNFRKRISDAIETNYSKISMGFHSELEKLGFKVEDKSIERTVSERTDPPYNLIVKEIELKISW